MVYYTGIWERALEPEEESREEREHLCDVTPPYFTQNSTSDFYFLKRKLNHRRKQAPQRKVRFFQWKGKKLHIISVFFYRILLGRVRTFVMLHFRVFDSFSSLFFFRLMRWTDSSAARRGSLGFCRYIRPQSLSSSMFFMPLCFSKLLKHIFRLLEWNEKGAVQTAVSLNTVIYAAVYWTLTESFFSALCVAIQQLYVVEKAIEIV